MADRKITIQDVARHAGVSKSTVSRVISDSSEISESTKERVRSIMEELNYYPSAIARSLASNRSMNIGLVLPVDDDFFINPFFQQSLRAISKKASERGYDVLIAYGSNEIQSIKRIIDAKKVDGLILMRSQYGDSTIEYLRSKEIPYVLIGRSLEYEDIYCVDTDNVKASHDVTEALICRGCKKIGFIAGDDRSVVTIQRYEGYRNAIEKNLSFSKELISETAFNVDDGRNSMKYIYEHNEDLDGVVITDDLMFLGALEYIQDEISSELVEKKRKIHIATFGSKKHEFININEEYVDVINIDVNAVRLGEVSCEKLIDLLQQKQVNTIDLIDYSIENYRA